MVLMRLIKADRAYTEKIKFQQLSNALPKLGDWPSNGCIYSYSLSLNKRGKRQYVQMVRTNLLSNSNFSDNYCIRIFNS